MQNLINPHQEREKLTENVSEEEIFPISTQKK